MKEEIILGKWTEDTLGDLLKEALTISDSGVRVDFLSRQFLKTDYKDLTLTGDMHTAEVFVINLEGLDCFTFIDYVEAMRRSNSFSFFKENLKKIRYRSGDVSFKNRNHFFTDWIEFNQDLVVDLTKQIGAEKCKDVRKRLNEKKDGTYFLPGVDCRLREITYIPSKYVDEKVLKKLKTGDYVGIYSEKEGLDVSHVGIIIKEKDTVNIRHAASLKKHREVVDEDLKEYLETRPGIIILSSKDLVYS